MYPLVQQVHGVCSGAREVRSAPTTIRIARQQESTQDELLLASLVSIGSRSRFYVLRDFDEMTLVGPAASAENIRRR